MGRDWLHGSWLVGTVRRWATVVGTILASSYCWSGMWDPAKAQVTEESSRSGRALERARRASLAWAAGWRQWVMGAREGSWSISTVRVLVQAARHRPLPILGIVLSSLVAANGLAAWAHGLTAWPGLAGRAAVVVVALGLLKAEVGLEELLASSRLAGLIQWFTTPDAEVGRP